MVAAIGVVVAIIAVLVAGLLVFRPPQTATLHLTTTPRDVKVSLDGVVVQTGATSPFVLTDVEPGRTHQVEVTREGYKPWASKVELQPDQTMELPPIVLERMESGFTVDSIPSGATIFVDGQELPDRTPARVVEMQAGDHKIRLEMDGYAPWESSLHVTPGTMLELPSANLQALEKTDDQDSARETRSKRRVYRPRTKTGTERTAEVTREPKVRAPEPEEPEPEPAEPAEPDPPASSGGSGKLRVQTRPWSKVFLDGRLLGTTPLTGIEVDAGRHTLKFVNPEFGIEKEIQVTVKDGDTVTKILTLGAD